jgi:beta-lactamase regulating signal transducer with metallopeptidase domain
MMCVGGTVMIVAIVIVRAIFMHSLPKKTFSVLWAAALGRLLLPFSLPARFSIFSLWGNVGSFLGFSSLWSNLRPATEPAGQAGFYTDETTKITVYTADNGVFAPYLSPLLLVWLAGMFLAVAYFSLSYWHCLRGFKASAPLDDATAERLALCLPPLSLKRHVTIRLADRIASPLTFGVWRPCILLPRNMDLSDTHTLQYVLAHEFIHIKQGDQIKKLVATAALCVHWFNPLVWVMYVLYNRDIEIACDEGVVRLFGIADRTAYASALIGMEEQKSRLVPLRTGTAYSGFSKYSLEERICAVMKTKKTTARALLLAFVLVTSIVAVCATSEAASGEMPAGLRRVYGDINNSYWRNAGEYTAYYLENPVVLGEHGTLEAVMFSDYELTLYGDVGFDKVRAADGDITVTSADGTGHAVGGYDNHLMSFFTKDDHSYIFHPTRKITVEIQGETYTIWLKPVPTEYHYARKNWLEFWEENVRGGV